METTTNTPPNGTGLPTVIDTLVLDARERTRSLERIALAKIESAERVDLAEIDSAERIALARIDAARDAIRTFVETFAPYVADGLGELANDPSALAEAVTLARNVAQVAAASGGADASAAPPH